MVTNHVTRVTAAGLRYLFPYHATRIRAQALIGVPFKRLHGLMPDVRPDLIRACSNPA